MAEAADSIIQLRGLTKSFGRHHVLRELDLDVPRGKILCIIGRSGEGKSVLLKHIIGLLDPDSGDVLIDGTSMVHSSSGIRRKLMRRFGMLFQNAALFDSMNVFDNVAFPIRESGECPPKAELRRVVLEKLALVGLTGVEDKMPGELSGGMRKRVGLARAIALDPEILLYDEPTTGLDPIRTHAVDRLILDTASSLKVTSVVITHDMQAVFEVADLVAFLYEGRIHALVTPEELREHPSEVVQAFLDGRSLGDASASQLD